MSISLDRILTGGLEPTVGIELESPVSDINLPNIDSGVSNIIKDVDFISDTDTSQDSFNNSDISKNVSSIRDQLYKAKEQILSYINTNKTSIDCGISIKNKTLLAIENIGVNDRDKNKKINTDNCGLPTILNTLNIQKDIISTISDSVLQNINTILNNSIDDISTSGCLELDRAKLLSRAINKYAKAVGSINGNISLKNAAINTDKHNCAGIVKCKSNLNLNIITDMIPISNTKINEIPTNAETINDKLLQTKTFENKISQLGNDTINKIAINAAIMLGDNDIISMANFIDGENNIVTNSNDNSNLMLKQLTLAAVGEIAFCLGSKGINAFVDSILSTGIATPSELVASIVSGLSGNIDINIYSKFQTIKIIIDGISDDNEKIAARIAVKHQLPLILKSIGKNKSTTNSPASMYIDIINGLNSIDPNWNIGYNGNDDYSLLADNIVVANIANAVLTSGVLRDTDKQTVLKHVIVASNKNLVKTKTSNKSKNIKSIELLPPIYTNRAGINYNRNIGTIPDLTTNKNVINAGAELTKSDVSDTVISTITDFIR